MECVECKKSFGCLNDLQKHEQTHASTSRENNSSKDKSVSKAIETKSKTNMVSIVKSAFRSRICILSLKNNNEECLIAKKFLTDAAVDFKISVSKFLKEHSVVKFNIELHGLYAKPKIDDLENTPLEIKTFQTKMMEMHFIKEYEKIFAEKIENILKKMDEFQERDSGWTLVQLLNINLNLNKCQPLKGSKYIPLPQRLINKKACINVQNMDSFCFKWAVISALCNESRNPQRVSKYDVIIESSQINVKDFNLDFKELSFPLNIKDINIFEENNPNISINVFGYDETNDCMVGPYYKTKEERHKHINLLFLQSDSGDNSHYIWIKDISRLIKSHQTKHTSRLFVCNTCIYYSHFENTMIKHSKNCLKRISYLPEPDKSTIEFKNFNNTMDVPFVIYADSECIFENIPTCFPNGDKSSTTLVNKHIPYAFSYYIQCSYNVSLCKFRISKGEDAPKKFIKQLVEDVIYINDNYLTKKIRMAPLTEEELSNFLISNICHICSKTIADTENKVRDHCHLTGKYKGPAHNSCNLNYKVPSFIPVIFHNFSSYDCHLFVKELNDIDKGPINIIPLNKELYISLTKTVTSTETKKSINIRFLDSYRFMPSSLDTLVKNLSNNELKIVKLFYSDDESQFNLLVRKGVFPYNYLNSREKLKESSLPKIDEFYNKLTDTHCSQEDYNHALEVWKKFNCKTIEDYLMLYLKSDVLLLADVFENFRVICKSIYKLDPCHYYTTPGLSWDAMLKITNIQLDLLTDIDMVTFIQKGIRGGIVQCSQRHSIANNKYLSRFDSSKPSKYLIYLDANNLYGWAMSQPLPVGNFQWIDDIENFSLDDISDDSEEGYILEVDLKYPYTIHDNHNDLPFCSENKTPPNSKECKLLVDLNDKIEYVIYYKNLKQCLQHGLKLTKIHRILKFKQSNWLEKYISLNNSHRTQAKNTFEKNFFKLLNNAVYGKTMENVDKHKTVKIVNSWEKVGKAEGARSLIANPLFHSCSIFTENMVAIELKKGYSLYNKPIYLGFTILELSKWKMYDFHYDYILPKYKTKAKLNYMDTDSFIYTIETNDFYKDIINDIDAKFDTSEYEIVNKFDIPLKNKKVLGMMKDENNGLLMEEFVGLRAKMYSFKTEDLKEIKKAKGVKINICKNLSLSDYKDCLFNKKIYYGNMYTFKSKLHTIYTSLINKITLSYLDNKRYVCNDNVNTLAWGHYKLPSSSPSASRDGDNDIIVDNFLNDDNDINVDYDVLSELEEKNRENNIIMHDDNNNNNKRKLAIQNIENNKKRKLVLQNDETNVNIVVNQEKKIDFIMHFKEYDDDDGDYDMHFDVNLISELEKQNTEKDNIIKNFKQHDDDDMHFDNNLILELEAQNITTNEDLFKQLSI